MVSATRKTIPFPSGLFQKAYERAVSIGVSFPQYVQYLVIADVSTDSSEPLRYVSERTEKAMIKAKKAHAQGKTKGFTDVDDMMKYLLGTSK